MSLEVKRNTASPKWRLQQLKSLLKQHTAHRASNQDGSLESYLMSNMAHMHQIIGWEDPCSIRIDSEGLANAFCSGIATGAVGTYQDVKTSITRDHKGHGKQDYVLLCLYQVPLRYRWKSLYDDSMSNVNWRFFCSLRYGHTEALKDLIENELNRRDLAVVELPSHDFQLQFAVTKGIHEYSGTQKAIQRCREFNSVEISCYGGFETYRILIDSGRVALKHSLVACVDAAAVVGDLKLIKHLHSQSIQNGVTGWTSKSIDNAIENGHLDVARWLFDNIPESMLDYYSVNAACRNGHLKVVEWLNDLFTRCEASDSDGKQESPWMSYAMDYAAANGHLDIVKFLSFNRTEGCTKYAMTQAAANGHLEVVKWLYDNRKEGCLPETINRAAKNGHLDVVVWFHEQLTNQQSVSNYRSPPKQNDGYSAGYYASATSTSKSVGYSNPQSTASTGFGPDVVFTSDAMDGACYNGHLEVVKWLHSNRTEGCTTAAMDDAARMGHLHIIKWLRENRTEGCTTDALEFAARANHVDVMQYLCEHFPQQANLKQALQDLRENDSPQSARFLSEMIASVQEFQKQIN